ncbi:J domain-containing protein [Lysobacter silvisoli]|uniref:J domain-containing protein n=1 Tax=Lysobacter silvisoli TaxID=2293254 RepID=A0A371K0U7_9GAMM|nr:J domain-containing protein [Lysobacter silvisoli]RDZ27472.1 J domain-containing protein [Lysobacter silvisoli]
MDPYEILGIRPNAGRDEIELAYKGRRSQYHPDRYAQSDAETQAWATVKMQEVNQAYRVLNEPRSPAEFDQRKASAKSGSRPPPIPEVDVVTKDDVQDVASILLKPDWEWFHDKVYARPHIPRKKLEGAIGSYAPAVTPSEVLVLLDDTVFGGAKEGLLVTGDAIYCKRLFEAPRRILFRDIQSLEPGTKSRVMVNGDEFFKADAIDHLAILTFVSRLATALSSSSMPPVNRASSRSVESSRMPGRERLWTLHRIALEATRAELGRRAFLIDELLDRQMSCIADHYAVLRNIMERDPRHRNRLVDADCAELALMLLLILHFYSLSRLPSGFKEIAGDQFVRLHEASEVYKAEYRAAFTRLMGREVEMNEHDLLMMSGMFFHRDGTGEFELKMPREEALLMLLSRLQISGEEARGLIRKFEDHAESWFASLVALVNK